MMIEIITTVETFEQAKELLEAGTDTLYFGEELFGLRLPASFTREEQRQLVELAPTYGNKVNIAMEASIKALDAEYYQTLISNTLSDKLNDIDNMYAMKKMLEETADFFENLIEELEKIKDLNK